MRLIIVAGMCVNEKSKIISNKYFIFISMETILTDPSCLSIKDNCYTEDCVCNCLTAKKLNVTATKQKDTCNCR